MTTQFNMNAYPFLKSIKGLGPTKALDLINGIGDEDAIKAADQSVLRMFVTSLIAARIYTAARQLDTETTTAPNVATEAETTYAVAV